MATHPRSVLITGCSASGIGAALAETFCQNGYQVFATARNISKISDSLARSPNVTVIPLDVLSRSSIAEAVESVTREANGKLDVLINNSGGGYIAPALDISIEDGKRLFDLNVWAPLAIVQSFAPLLIKAKGCIVNNTSANAQFPMPLMSAYNASKAALYSASETWRSELQPLGVRVVTLVTCAVSTNFFAEPKPVELPTTSPYYPVRSFVSEIGDGRLQKGAIPAAQYAKRVFRKVHGGSSGSVWAGTDSFSARLLLWLAPRWIVDMVIQSVVPLAKEMKDCPGSGAKTRI